MAKYNVREFLDGVVKGSPEECDAIMVAAVTDSDEETPSGVGVGGCGTIGDQIFLISAVIARIVQETEGETSMEKIIDDITETTGSILENVDPKEEAV